MSFYLIFLLQTFAMFKNWSGWIYQRLELMISEIDNPELYNKLSNEVEACLNEIYKTYKSLLAINPEEYKSADKPYDLIDNMWSWYNYQNTQDELENLGENYYQELEKYVANLKIKDRGDGVLLSYFKLIHYKLGEDYVNKLLKK